ncbi:hypothetical protein ES703_79278 [subsurface metagenome]
MGVTFIFMLMESRRHHWHILGLLLLQPGIPYILHIGAQGFLLTSKAPSMRSKSSTAPYRSQKSRTSILQEALAPICNM